MSGWNGTEYELFTNIFMYIGGKHDQKFKAGIAHLADDCHNEILCGATHLDAYHISQNESVLEIDDESWIRIGGGNSDPKLKASNSMDFTYVVKPSGVAPVTDTPLTIGYEGCWSTTGLTVHDSFVEVHFLTSLNDTISSGKTGNNVCLKPKCTTATPSMSPTPHSGGESPSPTHSSSPTRTCIPEYGDCSGSVCCGALKCTRVDEDGSSKCLDDTCPCSCPTESPTAGIHPGLLRRLFL